MEEVLGPIPRTAPPVVSPSLSLLGKFPEIKTLLRSRERVTLIVLRSKLRRALRSGHKWNAPADVEVGVVARPRPSLQKICAALPGVRPDCLAAPGSYHGVLTKPRPMEVVFIDHVGPRSSPAGPHAPVDDGRISSPLGEDFPGHVVLTNRKSLFVAGPFKGHVLRALRATHGFTSPHNPQGNSIDGTCRRALDKSLGNGLTGPQRDLGGGRGVRRGPCTFPRRT